MVSSVRERLHGWIDVLDEARAAALLAQLESEYEDDEFPPLTPKEMERVRRGIEQIKAGHSIPSEEIRRYFGLDR